LSPKLLHAGALQQEVAPATGANKANLMVISCLGRSETVLFAAMALVPIKTASETGYCDCLCGCYELAGLRDEDTGKGYCPACGKDHLDLNAGAGIPQPAPAKVSANSASDPKCAAMPLPADPPGRLR
jgi:hypothetical protein